MSAIGLEKVGSTYNERKSGHVFTSKTLRTWQMNNPPAEFNAETSSP